MSDAPTDAPPPATDAPPADNTPPPAEAPPADGAQPDSPNAPEQGAEAAGGAPTDDTNDKEALPNPPQGGLQPAGVVKSVTYKVQVKYLVLPEGFSHITSYPPDIPAVYMYSQLERDLCVDRQQLHISWEGRPFQETDILNEVATIPDSGPLILHLRFDNLPPHLAILSVGEITPGTRTVQINYGEGIPPKICMVALVIAFDKKPFIGGYSHKKTKAVYHHALIQTDPLEKENRMRSDKVSRETQTKGVTRTCQTMRECCTQMATPGLLINTDDDFKVVARPYFSAQQLHELRVLKSVIIQSHTRGWFARKQAQRLREEKETLRQQMAEQDEKRRQEHELKRQREIERRTQPRTAQDFNTLYNELEGWRLQETRKIKESDMSKEDKQLALQELLKKETKLLQTIHKLQNAANKENKERRVKSLLEGMTTHKKWGKSGTIVETPFTVRAKELMDLYNGLQLTGLSIDERLDVLLHVKWTVKEFSCPLTREIVELVDREADILNRGRPSKSLEGQRQQLKNLFLQFIEAPEFNPEAIHHQTAPLEYAPRPLVKLDNKR